MPEIPAAADEAMQDLVLTSVRATLALDRKDWPTVLDAAKRLQEHGMSLARIASRRISHAPVGVPHA